MRAVETRARRVAGLDDSRGNSLAGTFTLSYSICSVENMYACLYMILVNSMNFVIFRDLLNFNQVAPGYGGKAWLRDPSVSRI